ncbi:MAG: PadR family transcriptional regulator [Chloroflexota bacterium]
MEQSVTQLLKTWETNYKKGLLSFWILFLLHQKPMYAYELSAVIASTTQQTIVADEKSIYRALKRFSESGIVSSYRQKSDIGPSRRYFELTSTGKKLLQQFIKRNILIYQAPKISTLIQDILDDKEELND